MTTAPPAEPELAAAAGWPVVFEARKIRAAGRVRRATCGDGLIRGVVRAGSRTFASGLRLTRPFENLCSCSASWNEGRICAHSVAVALEVLHGSQMPGIHLPDAPDGKQSPPKA